MHLSNEQLIKIAEVERELYPEGSRVVYLGSEKNHMFLKSGMKGIVRYVDDEANVYIDWENGARVGLLYGQDYWKRIPKEDYVVEE